MGREERESSGVDEQEYLQKTDDMREKIQIKLKRGRN